MPRNRRRGQHPVRIRTPPSQKPRSKVGVVWAVAGTSGTIALVMLVAWGLPKESGSEPQGEIPNEAMEDSHGSGEEVPVRPLEGAGEVVVNIAEVWDRGCSPDNWSDADSGVQIFLDGRKIAEALADDWNHPVFGTITPVKPSSNSVLRIRAYEDEGANGPDIPCDVDPGPSMEAEIAWDGSFRELKLRGDSWRSVEVRLVLGRPLPAIVEPDIQPHPDGATFSWMLPEPAPQLVQVSRPPLGPILATAEDGTASVSVTGLCDNSAYTVRFITWNGPWIIQSEPIAFKTANAAPAPPQILSASPRGDSLVVAWQIPTSHDIDHYDIHLGEAGFQADSANRIATVKPFIDWRNQEHWVRSEIKEGYLRVVAIDDLGAWAASEEFMIGGTQKPETLRGPSEWCPSR